MGAGRVAAVVPDKAIVVFTPSGLRGEFPVGTTVLQAAQQLGVDLETICGGHGVCGTCQVLHIVGAFSKHGIESREEHLSPPSETEIFDYAETLEAGLRLGCCAQIRGDLVIDIPSGSQTHQQHVVKQATNCHIDHDPAVKLYTTWVALPDLREPASDITRLQQALAVDYHFTDLTFDFGLLGALQSVLNVVHDKGAGGASAMVQVTVAIHYPMQGQPRMIAVWPGQKSDAYGLAVDLGSTTIAAHLCDLNNGQVVATASMMNPQIRFGEDLMSRVSYVMMNEGGAREMTRQVRQAFNELAREAASQVGIQVVDILELSVVCNPIMHHLLLGIDPTPLGSAPFNLAVDKALELRADQLELNLHPEARLFVLPCLAGHIGADTAGVILAERPDLAEEMTLLVDVGTNAEIVLGNRHRLLAASSPTGPAFEGAQISCGQRAAAGAVERVRIDRETLEPRFKIIGCELWSDEPGFEAATANIGISGICGSGIIELIAELFLAGVIDADGVIDPAMAQKSERVVQDGRTFAYDLHRGSKRLRLTQNDVRAIQLAKAALYAGIRLLMDRMGIDRVERIALAGAFGSHIDVKYAMTLGLIPDCELTQVGSVGNAAGTGARIALLTRDSRTRIEQVLRAVEKVETALEARFQEHFVAAMGLPHSRDEFAQLRQVVTLPEKKVQTSGRSERREQRGRERRRRQGMINYH